MTTDNVRYQVFVSSTFTDLKEEREKVLQAILECQAFPSGMELFPSADNEQFEFIKREIDSSDYYLLIVAGRYGSVAEDGYSFTEKEFDYASENNKPILAFLVKDPLSLPVSKSESESATRNKLSSFCEKARKSRIVKFYENPDELKSQVLQALNYQFRVNPQTGWVPAGLSKRQDLEAIRTLQERVLKLEQENVDLKSKQESADERLAQGQDTVSWLIDCGKFTFWGGRPSGVNKCVEFSTTWDELFTALYPGGTSRLREEEMSERIWRHFWATADVQANIPELAELFEDHQLAPTEGFEQVKTDVQRQFAGLGLIEEITENGLEARGYLSTGEPRPFFRTIWRLTREGQRYLALMRGFKRSGR